ncbi:MAG: tRNA uridine-5-carboxymethylaminomethyl(34) synthesis enzyme MnmG [Spirochaetia bacterium]|nr:tRNA uridine-5-carboxymethylaminomethyl(34) synthesis enzyme MnmG [Spirochaetia bacterium]
MEKFNCIVVGGGHAGVEASYIIAKAGYKVLLITMNLDEIAQMSCNPAIGGVAKGHIVREVDALGGVMGIAIDGTGIHFKMLNRSKGSAMWGPRAQADKSHYRNFVKSMLENTENLSILQDTVSSLIVDNHLEKKIVRGVQTQRGGRYHSDHVILTTGTFLRGIIHIGSMSFPGGRSGAESATNLSPDLESLGFKLSRLKTGTPPRIHADSIDYKKIEIQYPDENPSPFSFSFEYERKTPGKKQIPCYVTYTTEKTKEIVTQNLEKSSMYGGFIKSAGPRYCPSIEDKMVRFAEKERHQIFLEPEGLDTKEVYVNGISTSLPEDIQIEMVHSIIGLENARIMRAAYAIEYDFVPPTQLYPWLETKLISGLYFAGQINGTTGYEEAAGQGLIAGYNVIHKIKNIEPFVLKRDEAYLGVLIDDLVTKGVEEPYRMFTSRAEYRLHLRQDNADLRLMKYASKIGINQHLYKIMSKKYEIFKKIDTLLEQTKVNESLLNFLNKKTELPVFPDKGSSLKAFFRRPQVSTELCIEILDKVIYDALFNTPNYENNKDFVLDEKDKINLIMTIKYEGYILREKDSVKRKVESIEKKIPANLDYSALTGLKTEARQKLIKIQPVTIGQAARISGVDPSDIDIIMVYLQSEKYKKDKQK